MLSEIFGDSFEPLRDIEVSFGYEAILYYFTVYQPILITQIYNIEGKFTEC